MWAQCGHVVTKTTDSFLSVYDLETPICSSTELNKKDKTAEKTSSAALRETGLSFVLCDCFFKVTSAKTFLDTRLSGRSYTQVKCTDA